MAGSNKGLHKIAFILLVIGGLDLLLKGLLSWDIGEIFGGMDVLISRIIYILIGIAALYEMLTHKGHCKECDAGVKPPKQEAPSAPESPSSM